MAIIEPSLNFEGSALNLGAVATPYIKDGVRRAVFNKTTNTEGAYLYFLPGYRADRAGKGVWFNRIHVRDNFGVKFKEKYYVENLESDPAQYFANNFKLLYPEESKVTDTEVGGRKFKKYPNHGRVTERLVYNVAFANNLSAGAHVLDLPLRNGADMLMNWLDGRDMSGNARKPINLPSRCVPVFVKLRENSANPWMIQVENNDPVQLPDQLADSDFLYNLDDIFIIKSKEEIISKLRDMYPPDVFDDCMDGYPGLSKRPVQGGIPKSMAVSPASVRVTPARSHDDDDDYEAPPVKIAPIINIPKATISAPVVPVNPPAAADIGSLPRNPMANRLSQEDAMRFLND